MRSLTKTRRTACAAICAIGAVILCAPAALGKQDFARVDFRWAAGEAPPPDESSPIRLHNVAGGPELELLQLTALDGGAGWRVWTLDRASAAIAPLADLPLPVEALGGQPLLGCWAAPGPGEPDALFALSATGGWLLRPDLAAARFDILPIFAGETALAEMRQEQGFYARPIAFDADGDGAAELYSFSPSAQALWRRQGEAYVRVDLPRPEPLESDPGLAGFGFFCRQTNTAADARRDARVYLSGGRSLSEYASQFQDCDFDGRLDFVWADPRRADPPGWKVAYQGPDGSFGAPRSLERPLFDWLPGASLSGPLNFDGDALPDFLAMRSVFRLDDPRTTVGVDYGRWKGQPGMRYSLRSRDPAGLAWIDDLDGDGVDDLCSSLFSYLVSSSGDLIDFFLRDDARFTLRFFFGKAGRGLAGTPEDALEVKVRTTAFTGQLAPPIDLSGDFNGDGRRDLLVRRSETQIELRLMSSSKRAFSKIADAVFEVDENQSVRAVDLNGDGKSDLLCFVKGHAGLRAYLAQ